MVAALKYFCLFAQLVTLGALIVQGQDRDIDRAEFWNYMRRSQAATPNASFRETTTVEKGESPDGPWKGYSSWVREAVFPDRSHIRYTSRSAREIIQIGKVRYARETRDGEWVEQDSDSGPGVTSPAGLFGFAPPATYTVLPSADDNTFRIKATGKHHLYSERGKDRKTYIYSFNGAGVLVKSESIVFNEDHWIRRIEIYEYDPTIKIEAPINE